MSTRISLCHLDSSTHHLVEISKTNRKYLNFVPCPREQFIFFRLIPSPTSAILSPSDVAFAFRIYSYALGAYWTVVFKANSCSSGVRSWKALAPEITLLSQTGLRLKEITYRLLIPLEASSLVHFRT